MKELKITPPDGYEIDKENSTFDCIKFKSIEKKYPMRIEDVPNRTCYLGISGGIYTNARDNAPINVSTKERVKAFSALMQLVELRDAWNKIDRFKVNWCNTSQSKYCILCQNDRIIPTTHQDVACVIHFGVYTTRNLFLETFKDLIEQAKELL
jgi:hypothetical protein